MSDYTPRKVSVTVSGAISAQALFSGTAVTGYLTRGEWYLTGGAGTVTITVGVARGAVQGPDLLEGEGALAGATAAFRPGAPMFVEEDVLLLTVTRGANATGVLTLYFDSDLMERYR